MQTVRNLILVAVLSILGSPALAAKDAFGGHIDSRTYGCVTGDTLVTLADGSDIPISKLQGHEDVLNGDNSAVAIAGIVVGPEDKKMIKLTTESGKSITATVGHPFYDESGLVRADEFQVGDLILTTDGAETIASVQAVFHQDNVFNVIVANPKLRAEAERLKSWGKLRRIDPFLNLTSPQHTLILNKFISGDLLLQNILR